MARRQRIFLTHSGVGVADAARGGPVWQCQWEEVREVVAWKVDVFTYDVICIGFRISDEAKYLFVSEEAAGYGELLAALKYQYGIRLQDWFQQVAFPAFRENWTVLWSERNEARGVCMAREE